MTTFYASLLATFSYVEFSINWKDLFTPWILIQIITYRRRIQTSEWSNVKHFQTKPWGWRACWRVGRSLQGWPAPGDSKFRLLNEKLFNFCNELVNSHCVLCTLSSVKYQLSGLSFLCKISTLWSLFPLININSLVAFSSVKYQLSCLSFLC